MEIYLGVLLALLSTFATDVAFLLKHRGACAAPDVSLRRPLSSALGLFGSKWFAVGTLVAFGAWVVHVGALALAPLSLVQAVMAGGLVFLTVLAERWFGCTIGRRQSVGVGLTALGLVLLVVTFPHGESTHLSYSQAGMTAFAVPPLVLGAFLVLSPRLGSHEQYGLMLGAAAGILFGVSNMGIEALTESVGSDGVAGLLSPWTLTSVAAGVIAFYASARGLQKGEAVSVITVTSAAANVSAITGGIVVFGDPMPSDVLGTVVQSVAFLLVIVAAVVVPPRQLAAG